LKKYLASQAVCITVSYMSAILTIRLDDDLQSLLDRACGAAGRTRSDLAREALKRQLTVSTFEELRRQVMPLASEQGFKTDEDIFRVIS
jgi:predicted transcriptional regulator